MLRYAVKLSSDVCATPSCIYAVSPAAIVFLALTIVFQGEARVPVLASLPVVATKNILPARTVKGRPLLEPTPGTFTTILPVVAPAPSWKIILPSDHRG